MQEPIAEQELRDRLSLIENIIAEGRRSTERWGWAFVLWGAAYIIAIAWSEWGHSVWAWPVTMVAALIVTVVAKTGKQPRTTKGRSIGSIWIALAISMFLVFMALGFSGKMTDPRVFVAVIAAMLGMANGASGLILRWKLQLGCAVIWWAASVASCFGTRAQSVIELVVAIFLCQIVFGIYCMIADAADSRQQRQHGELHA